MKDCIIPKVQGTVHSVGSIMLPKKVSTTTRLLDGATQPILPGTVNPDELGPSPPSPPDDSHGDNIRSPKTSLMSALALENFEPRSDFVSSASSS